MVGVLVLILECVVARKGLLDGHLLGQRDEVWQHNVRLKAELAERDKELNRLREFARYAEETLESLAREDEALSDP